MLPVVMVSSNACRAELELWMAAPKAAEFL